MTTKYFALLTTQGAARLANAAALGTKLQITQMAVGDGGDTLPTPDASQTALIGEKRRAALNSLSIDTANSSQIIAEQIIPESEGGFWIREIGLFDADGVMIAVANCAETYKPQLAEGSGRTQTVRMIIIVNSTGAVTLKIDPAVVLATRQYVDNAVIEVKAYTDDLMAKHVAAANPHSQYLQAANALKEIKDAGKAADALDNLGLTILGAGSALPVGIPVPWPTATAPTGWIKCNGASFSSATYPELAKAYPALKLPDLRGEFLRGWDDGRGVDSGRALLSLQDHTMQMHNHYMYTQGALAGTIWAPIDDTNNSQTNGDAAIGNGTSSGIWSTQSNGTVGNFASETRPRNVAFNYIVRAA
ncbi:phage tail protein [Pantoea phytobeneficialis]|uniref:Phage tail protein n=1 Tax=Pantoea phytobeneficialis TaxID=2052056 RepID=A0AAP9H7Q6_9GAMM|nr:phage tail protein [Pantoea phytobeneficialis]MDO6408663.1 phage tail protein [Pantoea phytobeneficialis]QGR08092.1 phage tail protein [Pantoea phytobeneficialis]